jgi:DNA-binding NtrC family response regulator
VSQGRILVVDDDPQIRRIMRMTLVAEGYEVSDARSGEQAAEKLTEEKFDLVLLDMRVSAASKPAGGSAIPPTLRSSC